MQLKKSQEIEGVAGFCQEEVKKEEKEPSCPRVEEDWIMYKHNTWDF